MEESECPHPMRNMVSLLFLDSNGVLGLRIKTVLLSIKRGTYLMIKLYLPQIFN